MLHQTSSFLSPEDHMGTVVLCTQSRLVISSFCLFGWFLFLFCFVLFFSREGSLMLAIHSRNSKRGSTH